MSLNLSGLPKRDPNRYRVTAIVLDVKASRRIVDLITGQVRLPEVPDSTLNEMQLAGFMATLTRTATHALQILEASELEQERTEYSAPQYERIQITLLSNDRVIGRIDGARQVFNVRGELIAQGELTPFDTSQRDGTQRGNGKVTKGSAEI